MSQLRKLSILIAIGANFFTLAGCAFFGGGSGIERASGYELKRPSSWTEESAGKGDKSFRLSSGNRVTVTSACGRESRASLSVLTRQLLIGTREVKYIRQDPMLVGNEEGLLSIVEAKMANRKFHLALFVVTKRECVFDFSLISRDPIPDRDLKEFTNFVQSFSYGKS